jgi:hypothetical protein
MLLGLWAALGLRAVLWAALVLRTAALALKAAEQQNILADLTEYPSLSIWVLYTWSYTCILHFFQYGGVEK